jgi:DNA-binding MarR family transcriptional regulator
VEYAVSEPDRATVREKHDGLLIGGLDVRLWLRLLSCSTIIEKRLRRRLADDFDTTLPRFDVMAALERHPGGMSMGELSAALLVSNGNVTALVRQLEAQGVVSRRPALEDGRSQIVALTLAGGEEFTRLAQAHHQWIAAMFAGVSAEDRERLFELLAILKRSIGSEAPRPNIRE